MQRSGCQVAYRKARSEIASQSSNRRPIRSTAERMPSSGSGRIVANPSCIQESNCRLAGDPTAMLRNAPETIPKTKHLEHREMYDMNCARETHIDWLFSPCVCGRPTSGGAAWVGKHLRGRDQSGWAASGGNKVKGCAAWGAACHRIT